MGHERLGILPRSRRWQQVVAQIGGATDSSKEMASLANNVLENVRDRFENVHLDIGVQRSFGFLIALTQPAVAEVGTSQIIPNVDLTNNPSPIQLTKALNEWVNENVGSNEYASLGKAAAADVIGKWTARSNIQLSIFEGDKKATEIWQEASSGHGFCEVARLYFAKFTERYLNYFLDREASAELSSIYDRQKFASGLREHLDEVSQHAFETSKITQSFSAGWYHRHVSVQTPGDLEVQRFLGRSFAKLREELHRALD